MDSAEVVPPPSPTSHSSNYAKTLQTCVTHPSSSKPSSNDSNDPQKSSFENPRKRCDVEPTNKRTTLTQIKTNKQKNCFLLYGICTKMIDPEMK